MSLTSNELNSLKRTDVQKLCKTLGIKGANQKTDTLIGLILHHYDTIGEDVASIKTSLNSRLLRPTASSWAKQASQKGMLQKRAVSPKRIVSRKRSSSYKARPKKEAPKSIKNVLAQRHEKPALIESTTAWNEATSDRKADGDEALKDEVMRAEAENIKVATTELTSTSNPTSTSKPNEVDITSLLFPSSSACTCMNSTVMLSSQPLVDPRSVWDALTELTAKIHSLPTKEESDLDMQRFYDALERTDVAIKSVSSRIDVSDRMRNLTEQESVKKGDVEAMVNRLIDSRLEQIEQSVACRLKAMEDKLTAQIFEKHAPQVETMVLSDLSMGLGGQRHQISSKRAWDTVGFPALISSVSIANDFTVDRETLITSTPSSMASFKTSFPLFSPPVFSVATALDDHRPKRSKIDSLVTGGMAANTVGGLLKDLPERTISRDDTSLISSATQSSIASPFAPVIAPTIDTSAPVASTLIAGVTSPQVCRTPLLVTGQSARSIAPLPLAFRPGSLKPKDNNHYSRTAPSSRQPTAASALKCTAGSQRATGVKDGQPSDTISYPSFSPFERQTVQSLLPPAPAGAPLWISPMASPRPSYRYRPKAKQGPTKEGVTPLPLSATGAHNARLGLNQNIEIAPPTPAGPKTMFGTEKETFGRMFGDEMTPWMS
ncbi:hypothetical protein [Phaffia rhodozyma]|uniref:Uncharacterized protein n=1 Tax=Phaffia rhodozyma TaxID=264483 RepID=A0A0F7SFR8_PHARH|nr:hypothetical protein [Phaffia rhodozyma]